MGDSFGTRLTHVVREYGPLCVGVDPSSALVESWGRPDSPEGLEYVARGVVAAASGVVGIIKPQVAYFERFGAAGFAVLEKVLQDARDAELLIIGDAKRGDIGSTNDGYAEAWLSDASPLRVDALTANPFLGVGALLPLFERARATNRGVFVLAATSNPEGHTIQNAHVGEQENVTTEVLSRLRDLNSDADGLGSFGAVLGATRRRPQFDLASLNGPFLVPGVGAQGGEVGDVAALFDGRTPHRVVVNVGRAILSRGPQGGALRDAMQSYRDELIEAL